MTKTALVTGGARGIGRACALALSDAGFDIAAHWRKMAPPPRAA